MNEWWIIIEQHLRCICDSFESIMPRHIWTHSIYQVGNLLRKDAAQKLASHSFSNTPLCPLYNKNKIECNWNLNGNCSHLKNLPKHRKRVCIQLFQATLGSYRYLEEQGFEQKRVDKFKIKCMCSWWSENSLGLNFWPESMLLEGVFQSNTSAENQLRF